MAPCATLVRCIEPPLPPMSPQLRPMSSPRTPTIGAPRASVWAWPRYVQNVKSSARIATAKPAATASCPSERWLVPLTRFWRNRSYARCSSARISTRRRYRSSRVGRSMSSRSIGIGDEELLRREERDDAAAVARDHHLLLDARGGMAVARRAIGLGREDHAFLDLD